MHVIKQGNLVGTGSKRCYVRDKKCKTDDSPMIMRSRRVLGELISEESHLSWQDSGSAIVKPFLYK